MNSLLILPAVGLPHPGYPDSRAPKDPHVERAPLIFAQGEQRILEIAGLDHYSLGSSVVRSLKTSKGSGLLLKAISPGHCDLWVWKKDGSTEHRPIEVVRISREDLSPGLLRGLSQLQECDVLFNGKGAVLRGTLRSLRELETLAGLTQLFPDQIKDQTIIDPVILKSAETKLQNWISDSPYASRLRIEKMGTHIWIRGSLDSPQARASVQKMATGIFPLVQLDIDSLPDHAPTVYFRVYLLELKKQYFRSFGLKWPGSTDLFQIRGGIGDQLDTSPVHLSLEHLETEGHGTLLSNPELVVRAPGEAELFAGGELPIRTKTKFASNVLWKTYGLTLKLNVTHVSGSRIRLDIFTEVSHLNLALTQDEIPAVQSNRMKTQVDAQFGVPLLLSGLLQKGLREEVRGLPLLKNLPILGALFGSEDYLNEQSELVAILYPHSSPPPAPTEDRSYPKGSIPLPRNWVSPKEERALRDSETYPWNALQ